MMYQRWEQSLKSDRPAWYRMPKQFLRQQPESEKSSTARLQCTFEVGPDSKAVIASQSGYAVHLSHSMTALESCLPRKCNGVSNCWPPAPLLLPTILSVLFSYPTKDISPRGPLRKSVTIPPTHVPINAARVNCIVRSNMSSVVLYWFSSCCPFSCY